MGETLKKHRTSISACTRTGVAVAVTAVALLATEPAAALGLGRITVQTVLGEPLRAEIEITSLSPEEAASLRPRIASPEAFRAAGVEFSQMLVGAQLTLQRRSSGQVYLLLVTTRAAQEPFVDVVLDLSWSTGRLVREYTMLVDPAPVTARAAPAPAQQPARFAPVPAATPAPAVAAAPAPRPAPVAQASPPAPRPIASAPAASAGSPAPTAAVEEVRVRRGDTLWGIAERVRHPSVSLDQMLVALYRANPEAFMGDNMNRMRAGAVLRVPGQEGVAGIDPREARQLIVAQSADFDAYRQRLAGLAPQVARAPADRQAAGRVEAAVQEGAGAGPAPVDKLTLSKGEVADSRNEAQIARSREERAATERLAELSRNIEQLRAVQSGAAGAAAAAGAAGASAPAPAPGVSLPRPPAVASASAPAAAPGSSARPATPSQAPASAAPATAASSSTSPSSAPLPAGSTASAQAPAPAAGATSPSSAGTPGAASPAPVVAAAPAPASAAASPAPAPAAAPAAPPRQAAAPTPAAQPSFLDSILENPLVLPLAGLLIALLAALGIYRVRQRSKLAAAETSFLESRLQPDSFFGASGGQRVDTRDSHASGTPSSLSYSLSQLDAIGDVDPVAEADVYLAYGRDLQAEEILKEAMRTTPERLAIRTKLLEIYAKRRDHKAFELLASQLFAATGGQGEDWARVQELGYQLDPDNAMYRPGGAPGDGAVVDHPGPGVSSPAGMSTIPDSNYSSTMSLEAVPTEASARELDLDLGALSAPEPEIRPAEITQPFVPESAPASASASLDGDGPTVTLPGAGAVRATDAEATRPFAPKPSSADQDFVPTPAIPSPRDEALDLSMELPSLDFAPDDGASTARKGAAAPVSDTKGPDTSRTPLEFDLSDLSLDLADEPARPSAEAAVSSRPIPLDIDDDPLSTKLALAEEFRQIGDTEGARELLEEVVEHSSGTMKSKAQQMLQELA